VASIRWVRPLFTTSANSLALLDRDSSSRRRAGINAVVSDWVVAMWIALGKTSLLDWEALTWSLGCTGAPCSSVASDAITSLAFMLLDVPDPVWKTSIGNSAGSIGTPEMGKFSTARWVCAFQRASAFTRTSPMVSCSMRKSSDMGLILT